MKSLKITLAGGQVEDDPHLRNLLESNGYQVTVLKNPQSGNATEKSDMIFMDDYPVSGGEMAADLKRLEAENNALAEKLRDGESFLKTLLEALTSPFAVIRSYSSPA